MKAKNKGQRIKNLKKITNKPKRIANRRSAVCTHTLGVLFILQIAQAGSFLGRFLSFSRDK
jgi:hypothetical protein